MNIATWIAAVFLFFTLVYTVIASNTAASTLKETQRANALQLKPYFKITASEKFFVANESKDYDHSVFFRLNFRIKNIGKSPAENVSVPKIEKLHIKWPINECGLACYDWKQVSIKTDSFLISPSEDMPSTVFCVIEGGRISQDLEHLRDFLNHEKTQISFSGSFSYADIECSAGDVKECRFTINQNVMTKEILDAVRSTSPICKVTGYSKKKSQA